LKPDRALVGEMLKMDKYIDMLIRAAARLHKLCREQSTIPVITGGIGVCHIYIDSAEWPALKIIVNAKTQRPSTCNSVETLLVHQDIAEHFPASAEQADGGKRRYLARGCAILAALQKGPAAVDRLKRSSMTMSSVAGSERENGCRSG
jgi:glutamate-5-semialdehyde dehydrogenase